MDLAFSEEQLMLRDSVRRYVGHEHGFESRRDARSKTFDAARWKKFAELGWLGAGLPEAYGGLGGGITEVTLIQEEFGRGLVVEPVLAFAVLAPQVLLATGDRARSEALLARIAAGEFKLVLAHNEAAARGDLRFVSASARKSGGGYTLRGHKAVVMGAPVADRLLVSARMEGDTLSERGISLFLIDPDTPGVELLSYRTIDDQPAADVILRDVAVPQEALVGSPGQAYAAIEYGIDYTTVVACADALGAMDAALWITRDYLKMRRQFGTALSNFQALQHRMADMFIDVEQSRSMLYRGISVFGQPDRRHRRRMVMASHAFIAQAARFVGGQAIQLHGAIAMTDECSISHYYKRLFAFSTLWGGIDFCLAEFGRLDGSVADGDMNRDEFRIFA